jgi:N-alpha-acetyltransferase 15/16, NatA auxiliary subunit
VLFPPALYLSEQTPASPYHRRYFCDDTGRFGDCKDKALFHSMSKATAVTKAAAAAPSSQQVLAGKEAANFKEVNRLYECRDYKKALRLCDDILKKVPDHGETMALKAMCLQGSGKKEEAMDMSRRALKANMKSQVTWHVLGTMHRADMNHREAMRCFLQALKWDKDNLNILRDLATVQVHIGEYKMHAESRRQIMQLNPKLRQSWHGFAVSLQLGGNYAEALRAMCAYEDMCAGDVKSLKETPESRDEKVENVEAVLYHCMLLEEGMGPGPALDYLHAVKDSRSPSVRALLVEPNSEVTEILARLNLAAGHLDAARSLYSRLLFFMPECAEFHLKLMVSKGIVNPDCSVDAVTPPSAAQQLAIDHHIDACIGRLPPSAMRFIHRLRLGLLSGDLFRTRLDEYLQSGLHKGMPSLHQGIKPLYKSAERLPILSACIEEKLVYLREHGRLPLDPQGSQCPPDVFFWCMFMTAQHRLAVGRLEDALAMIVEATQHTPTVLDSYMVKARILKRMGDFAGAEAAAEEARCMDLADRFINTFSTRYQIKNGHFAAAEATLMLFCKNDEFGPALQTNWYVRPFVFSHW